MANLSTQNIGANYKGILNLGSTINTPLSTTLQNITDGDGNTSPLQLATNRIALGSGTISGTSLLNFPDAGTTAADGISFGNTTLYRSASSTLTIGGTLGTMTFEPNSGGGRIIGNSNGGFVIRPVWDMSITHAGGGSLTIGSTTTNLTPPPLTGSSATSALSISQTWNTTGNPNLIDINITNTASGTNATFAKWKIGGVTFFSFDKNGYAFASSGLTTNNGEINGLTSNGLRLTTPAGGGVCISNDYSFTSASAQLEIKSTSRGFLPPRMTTAQKNAIASPAAGLMVYDTTLNQMSYYNGTAWVNF